MAGLKLIAEPWDLGPYGYQLGNFPPGWAEWNGQYRDTVRRFWKRDKGLVADLASRVAGSSDIFGYRGRRPWASINFVTAHDGFTLQDLVSYNDKHNEANGEDNRDGTDANYSCELRCRGTDRPIRRSSPCATARSAICWPPYCCRSECRCCLPAMRSGGPSAATTTPIVKTMKSPGSTGNISGPRTRSCAWFVRYLIHLRRRHRVFSRPRFLRGEVLSEAGVKDITWITPSGKEATTEDWRNPAALVARLCTQRRGGRVLHPGRSTRYRRELSRNDECLLRGTRFSLPGACSADVVGAAGRYRRADRARNECQALRAGRNLSTERPFFRAVHQPGAATEITPRGSLLARFC